MCRGEGEGLPGGRWRGWGGRKCARGLKEPGLFREEGCGHILEGLGDPTEELSLDSSAVGTAREGFF